MSDFHVIEEYEIEEYQEAEGLAELFEEELYELRADLLHQLDEIDDELDRREARYQEH